MGQKLLIAGPGRSGTTLLVQIMDRLGFDTGANRLKYFPDARAGLEADILSPTAPYVVKNPALSWKLRGLIADGRIRPEEIDHVIIPVRELSSVVASRLRGTFSSERRRRYPPGGLIMTRSPKHQARVLAEGLYDLCLTLADYEISFTVISYPRFAQDPEYAFRMLSSVLGERSEEEFLKAWRAEVKPELIFDDNERRPTIIMRVIWRWPAIRKAINRRSSRGNHAREN